MAEQKLIKGFVRNEFRGDAALLAPGPQMLQDLTGVPTVATLRMWWQHGLPEENSVFDDSGRSSGAVTQTIAVMAYPRISNLDEFQLLKNVPGLRLLWVRSPAELAGLAPTEWVILPGSKATTSDLAWLHGLFEDPAVLAALFGATVPALETVFDGLADSVDQHFDAGFLQSLVL